MLTALTLAFGCAGNSVAPTGIKDTVRRTYFEAMNELVGGNFVKARQLFNQVARSPRFFRYAALAKLRIGDSLFMQERFAEAIEFYRSFAAQHRSDPNLPYARYRMAVSYYKRMPSEWFASVADYEIDQTMTREAVRELSGFLQTFPVSRYAEDVREKLGEARNMLVEHILYVADFYDSRDKPRAVAWRIQSALKDYADLIETEALVWRMADAFAKAGDRADAARAYARYLEAFQKGPMRAEAKKRLEAIRQQVAPGKP